MNSNPARLTRLIACYGYECNICGRRLIRRQTMRQPNDTATVEHRYPKTDIRRYLVSEAQNTRLACRGCNDRNNRIETERLNAIRYALRGDWVNLLAMARANGGRFIDFDIYKLFY